jgi:hypothetical protein
MKPKTAAGAAALVAYFVAQSDNEMSVPEKWHYQSLFKVAAALKEIAKAAWSGARQILRDGSPASRRAFCYVGCSARPVSVGQRVSGPSAFGDEPAAPGSALPGSA